MYALLVQLEGELETVDLADAEQELLPIEPRETRIGVLGDEQRRWHALQILEFRENRLILYSMNQLMTGPVATKEMEFWFLKSRFSRVRIHALQGLFILSINRQFPGVLDNDVILIREGWTLVSKREEDLTVNDIEIGNIIAADLAHPGKRTIN